MAKAPKPLIAGNWKMNGLQRDLGELRKLIAWMRGASPSCDVMICPPATLISDVKSLVTGSRIKVGAQTCHAQDSGAHTGDISAPMLKNAGASAVIAGHSERRADHKESDKQVRAQAEAIHRAGLTAIICVGETAGERKAGKALKIVSAQLKGSLPSGATARNTVIAYEPVWAIGTGLTATPEDVARVHRHIRTRLGALMPAGEGGKVRILYGGSVKPENAATLMGVANVDGALVGGASLKAKDFQGIISAYA